MVTSLTLRRTIRATYPILTPQLSSQGSSPPPSLKSDLELICGMDNNDEMCPICRSSRYLNPEMKLLVNPECYHKMCQACVDRLFSVGPAPCPYVGCGATLRRARFKEQVFESLDVEREVDVRQRLCRIYNRRPESFESDKEYGDYLEHLEDLIYAIADGTEQERRKAKEEVAQYELKHKQEILQTTLSRRQEEEQAEELQRQESERQMRLRQLAYELEQQQLQVRQECEQELLADLAASSRTPDEVLEQMQKRIAARTSELQRKYDSELAKSISFAAAAAQTSSAARRRAIAAQNQAQNTVPATPFTPFNGDRQKGVLYNQRDDYFDPWMQQVDSRILAGGFSVRAAQHEALTLAFMGLDINIEQEKSQSQFQSRASALVAT